MPITRTLVRIGCSRGRESKLLLELALDRYDRRQVYTQGQLEMQARGHFFQVLTETLDHGNRITGYGIVGGPQSQPDEYKNEDAKDSILATTRHQAAQAKLSLTQQGVEIRRVRSSGSIIPR